MLMVHVDVNVKPEFVDAFKEASIENAKSSVQEPGVVRFDVIQNNDDPTKFVLVEIYGTNDDPARHKETDHYKNWRDAVEKMMARPRSSTKFHEVFYTP